MLLLLVWVCGLLRRVLSVGLQVARWRRLGRRSSVERLGVALVVWLRQVVDVLLLWILQLEMGVLRRWVQGVMWGERVRLALLNPRLLLQVNPVLFLSVGVLVLTLLM